MAKININEHILPIFLINFINIIGKNNKIQRIFQRQFLKNRMSDLAEIQLIIKFSLPFSLR